MLRSPSLLHAIEFYIWSNNRSIMAVNNVRKSVKLNCFSFSTSVYQSPKGCFMKYLHPISRAQHKHPRLEQNVFFWQCRSFSDEERPPSPSGAEMILINILREKFPSATDIAVVDISGGCGSMYEVFVESPDFKGIRIVKQHQMVTEALKAEIKDMHGLRISTSVSEQ